MGDDDTYVFCFVRCELFCCLDMVAILITKVSTPSIPQKGYIVIFATYATCIILY